MKKKNFRNLRLLLVAALPLLCITLSVSTVLAAWIGNLRITGNSVGTGTYGSYELGAVDADSLRADLLGRIAWDPVVNTEAEIAADRYSVEVVKDGEEQPAYSGTTEQPYFTPYALAAGIYTLKVTAGHSSSWVTGSDVCAEIMFKVDEIALWNAADIDTGAEGAFRSESGDIQAENGVLNSTGKSNYGWISLKNPIQSINMDKNPLIVMDVESAVGGYFFRAAFEGNNEAVVSGDYSFDGTESGYYVLRANLDQGGQENKETAQAVYTGVKASYNLKPGVMSDVDNADHVITQINFNSIRIITVAEYIPPVIPDEPTKLATPDGFAKSRLGVVSWNAVTADSSYTPTYDVTVTNTANAEDKFTFAEYAATSVNLAALSLTDGATYEISVVAKGDTLGADGASVYFSDSDAATCRVTYRVLLSMTDFTDAEIVMNRLGQQGDAFSVSKDETGLSWTLTNGGGWGAFGITLNLAGKELTGNTAVFLNLAETSGSPKLLFVSFKDAGSYDDGSFYASAEDVYSTGVVAVPESVSGALAKVGDNVYFGLGFGGSSSGTRTAKITSLTVAEYISYGEVDVTPQTAQFDMAAPAAAEFDVTTSSAFDSYVAGFAVDGTALTSDQYTFADSKLTLSADYLSSLGYGEYTVTAADNLGNTGSTKITVMDSRIPAIKGESSAVYAQRSMTDVEFSFITYDKTFDSITLSGEQLQEGDNYTVRETAGAVTVTLKSAYLETLEPAEYKYSVKFSDNTAIECTLSVEALPLPEVTQTGAAFAVDGSESVTFDVNLNGAEFVGVAIGSETLKAGTDYAYETGAGSSGADLLTVSYGALTRAYRTDTLSASLVLITDYTQINFDVTLDNAAYRVLNGGFETGDLYGWTAYYAGYLERSRSNPKDAHLDITNAHLDRSSFTDSRVSSEAAWKEGDYALEVNPNEASQMGYLRSAPFKLGGSGWISFVLGGGKYSFFDYLSVKVEGSGLEVARFSAGGASEPVDYIFDLKTAAEALGLDTSEQSAVRYYFLLSEAAIASETGYSLSADSFCTYYAEAPSGKTTAVDIKPNVVSADSPPENWAPAMGRNEFINVLQKEGFQNAIDDPNFAFFGDGVKGLVRTPAFTWSKAKAEQETGWHKIRFYLGSGRNSDYGLISFISFKEVGTNVEVYRTWVSGSNGSSNRYETVVNLLDSPEFEDGKAYYIEVCNNITGGNYGNIAFGEINIMSNADANADPQIFVLRAMDTSVAATALNDTVYSDFEYIAPWTVA